MMNAKTHSPRKSADTVSRAEFDTIRAQLEDMEDRLDLLQAQASGPSSDALPGDYVDRLLSGESALRVWRDYRGLSQIDLSKAAGVSKTYLCEVENGKKPGSVDFLRKCAAALNVSMDSL